MPIPTAFYFILTTIRHSHSHKYCKEGKAYSKAIYISCVKTFDKQTLIFTFDENQY